MGRTGDFLWLELNLSVMLAILSLPSPPSPFSLALVSFLPFLLFFLLVSHLPFLSSPHFSLFYSLTPSGWKCGNSEEAGTWTVSLDWAMQHWREGM